MEGCIKEVVCRLLKGGQHEHAVLHLGNAKSGDAQDLPLQSTAQHNSPLKLVSCERSSSYCSPSTPPRQMLKETASALSVYLFLQIDENH